MDAGSEPTYAEKLEYPPPPWDPVMHVRNILDINLWTYCHFLVIPLGMNKQIKIILPLIV